MSTEEILDTSLKLLRLVILNDQDAKTRIHEVWKNSQVNISYVMKFRFYRKGYMYNWNDFCECWYTNEYFEYVNSKTVDLELFESVTDNIRKGHCPHFDPDSPRNSRWSGISLIHAAAATGNKAVIKYLLTINKRLKFSTTNSANLPPMIIAVLKNQASILKCLHVEVLDLSYIGDASIGSRIKRALLERRYNNDKYLNISSMVVATRDTEDGDVTVKRILNSFSFVNPFAEIYYSDVAPSESIINIIRCYLNEEEIQKILKYEIYRQTKQEATNIVSWFSKYVSHFNADLVLECILWNNLEALSIIIRKLRAETLHYSGYSFVSIADFLNHMECASVLQDFFSRFDGRSKRVLLSRRRFILGAARNDNQSNTGPLEPVDSPFSVMLELSLQRGYDSQSTCKLLSQICTNRYDINYRNKYGMTPVHKCLESNRSAKCLKAILETLLRKGADANIQDINGRSVLYMTLTPYNSPLGYGTNRYHVIGTMKTVLYHNAVPAYTKTAIHHAISRDKMNSFLEYIHDESATVILTKYSTTTKIVIAETNRDKFLALSFVAILIELGFAMEKSDIILLNDLPTKLRQYVNDALCTPRCLQSTCRNVIRNAYPGPELQKFLEVVHIPDVIADIILFKPYLLPTTICLASGKKMEIVMI